jgi:hypothetical protein
MFKKKSGNKAARLRQECDESSKSSSNIANNIDHNVSSNSSLQEPNSNQDNDSIVIARPIKRSRLMPNQDELTHSSQKHTNNNDTLDDRNLASNFTQPLSYASSRSLVATKSAHTATVTVLAGDDAVAATEMNKLNKQNEIQLPKSRLITASQASAIQLKAPAANIRTISRFDFQPDICKDYKETGYCGFGDSCKFLHDRSFEDEKYARKQDEDWNKKQEAKRQSKFNGKQDDDEDEQSQGDSLPFACAICRKPFSEPAVRTLCKHYFCQGCALDYSAKSTRCFTCRSPTQGIFNSAPEIKINHKQESQSDETLAILPPITQH